MSEGQPAPAPKTRYKPLLVRQEVHDMARSIARMRKSTISSVVSQALMFWRQQIKRAKIKNELPMLDKAVWYTLKLASAYGALRAVYERKEKKEVLHELDEVFQQIRDRMQINVDPCIEVIGRYIKQAEEKRSGKRVKPDIIMDATSCIKNMIYMMLDKALVIEDYPPEPQQQPQS